MGVSSSESHDLTAFYEMLTASFGVLSQNTGFYPSLDRIVENTLGPLNLGPGGGSYNEPISRLHRQPRQLPVVSATHVYLHGLRFSRTILCRPSLTLRCNVSISVLPPVKVYVTFGYLRQVGPRISALWSGACGTHSFL